MNNKRPRCLDCFCEVFVQSERRRGRHLVAREISFSCGARQKEFLDREGSTARVEFESCGRHMAPIGH